MLSDKDIGHVLSAQLFSLIKSRDYSYVSSTPAYSHLEDSGKKVMAELVDMMFIKAVEYNKKRIQDEAEKLVMDNLKK
jgi:hypothetical protein